MFLPLPLINDDQLINYSTKNQETFIDYVQLQVLIRAEQKFSFKKYLEEIWPVYKKRFFCENIWIFLRVFFFFLHYYKIFNLNLLFGWRGPMMYCLLGSVLFCVASSTTLITIISGFLLLCQF